ncbi:hypothetical protein SAMD00019534_030860 [Acytostelium subglobosum LB1]|uniref:hypothetical protein n=1 Tax=Acytostelium subglobosum LB1 TaxID=1410327 RepID=UPI0006450499|nr:hypothetical protein SAMD00019534_030860 [Acytostelium subglobosum LB1]GAM19911.1 hypothetical protein SAMD00019534_030860 [Acytostelium subglobosum LB1]|eukprot:XP_012756673.1 hypothetical protein SAMD00019534_030860 [Acytostelium subglobosum LB1]
MLYNRCILYGVPLVNRSLRVINRSSYSTDTLKLVQRPLDGLKVLDLSRVLAGPWSTQILGDLGAEVIKVESIKGDDTRQWGPPFYQDPQGNVGSAYFSCANRNKKSIAIDFTKKEGQDIIHRIAKESDVVMENYKVGGLTKYNLDYPSLSKINPGIVYCSITGFGQTGPMKDLPGYDFATQAMGGLMSITGSERDPYKCGVAIVDIMTGLYASVAIQSALIMKGRTGKGQHIDVSLLDVQSTFLANIASSYLLTGKNPSRIGNSHPSISPYDSLRSSDGFFVVAVGNDGQFRSMCNTMGLKHIATDSRYINNSSRVANRQSLLEIINEVTSTKKTSEWIEMLGHANVPCAPINNLSEVFSLPQIQHRNMVWNLDLSNQPSSSINQSSSSPSPKSVESIRVVGSPMHFSESDLHHPDVIHTPPPTLGQHTEDILCQHGYTKSEVNQLKQSNTIA